MATIEYWIQLENHAWDASPNNIDRLSGETIKDKTGDDPVEVTLTSPGTGASHKVDMNNPLRDQQSNVIEGLILRRYKPPSKADESDAWTVPDDRKVNPWDLNEPDPTDAGTMGTIPGPVLECNVGDSVVVHFRNHDMRTMVKLTEEKICFDFPFVGEICFPFPGMTTEPLPIEKRVHSLHPHGFVFKRTKDGAYPLSPPDPTQPIPASEAAAWAEVPGFSGSLKQGDRIPPGGTFTYEWNTFGWPTTAGVWLYHDHSICDMENVELGAIGIIVIHNPADTEQEVDIRDPSDPMKLDPAFLPGGDPNGSPIGQFCLPDFDVRFLPHDLAGLGDIRASGKHHREAMIRTEAAPEGGHAKRHKGEPPPLATERLIRRGDLILELDDKLEVFRRLCLPQYRTPPTKGLYLQLFHTMQGVPGMAINGRTFLGNTPTILAGRETLMRFGVVGMGSDTHTFHIHGHRWVLPGPDGTSVGAIQSSAQVQAVSQFEDTRLFGPANSFVFTVDAKAGSFMRAGGPSPDDSIGEWHMHCHVLGHMMTGMMGSLLIVRGGELALGLPEGVPCGEMEMPGMGGEGMPTGGTTHIVDMQSSVFNPSSLAISHGDSVKFVNHDNFKHSVVWDTAGSPPNSPDINPAGTAGDSFTTPAMNTTGTFNYHCGFHGAPGAGMHGSITVNP